MLVHLIFRDGHGKRDQMDAPPDAGISAADDGFMVGTHPQLEFRDELELAAILVTRCDLVAAGQLFEQTFIELHALARLDRGDKACALETGNVAVGT